MASAKSGSTSGQSVPVPADRTASTTSTVQVQGGPLMFKAVELEEVDTSIVVVVRVRPLAGSTSTLSLTFDLTLQPKSVLRVEGNTVFVDDVTSSSISRSTPATPKATLSFTYDHCLWSGDQQHPQQADQQKVYEVVAQPLLDKAFEGFNTCIFAYGQTGSGKSYSVMGPPDDPGIIPRFSQDLFERIQTCEKRNERISVEISYYEIYNEKIHDLLASSGDQSKKVPIKIREHNVIGPYVVGLSTFVVTCHDDLASWVSLGNKQRATAATVMNEKSSRSHSVFTIVVTRVQSELIDGEIHEHSRRSKVNIVDLAGSERVDSGQTKVLRLKEGASINKSLLTLGRVITQLSEASLTVSTPNGGSAVRSGSSRKKFVPYRDSVLTWLLKESLGGNSQTTMLATVSPCSASVEETLSTLRYARQARSIVNMIHVNEDPKARLIRELRAEIEKLRGRQQVVLSPQNADSPLKTNFLDFIQNIEEPETSILRPSETDNYSPMLYELDMMIQEANCLCDNLGKQLKFEQFDKLVNKEFVVVVRVTNQRTHLILDWSLETFAERLRIIRLMNEGEDHLELFADSDQWIDNHFSMTLTTKDRETIHKVQQLLCNNVSMMDSFESPPLGAIRSARSLAPASGDSGSSSNGQFQSVDPLAICGDNFSSMLKCFSEFSENNNFQVNTCKLLTNLSEMKSHVTCLQEVTSIKDLQVPRHQEWAFKLNSLLTTLLMRASKLLPTSPSSKRSKKLGSQFCSAIQYLGDSVTSILLDVAENLSKDVPKAASTLMDRIVECSNLVGQLTLSLCVPMDPDGSPVSFEVDGVIGLEFLSGIESVVRQVFENAVGKIDAIEVRMNTLGDDSYLRDSSKGADGHRTLIVPACLDSIVKVKSWIELYRDVTVATSKRRTECSIVERLVRMCNQSQQICVNLSHLVETIENFCDDVEIFARGELVDFKETLMLLADIHGAIEILFSLSEIHHFVEPSSSSGSKSSTSPASSQRSVEQLLRAKVQATASANRKLKKIVRQIADSQRHSSQSSTGGESPMFRSSPLTRKRPVATSSDDRTSNTSNGNSGGAAGRGKRKTRFASTVTVGTFSLSPGNVECPAVVIAPLASTDSPPQQNVVDDTNSLLDSKVL